MALRNGLEDRPYIDWVRADKCCYIRNAAIDATGTTAETLTKKINKNRWYGVGSVLRIIPGVDLCSGGAQTLIGGMKISNETIRFRVKYRLLNLFEDGLTYSLYVAFEYNGICTITPGFCDLAMIRIGSCNQIANTEKAPCYKINMIYGKGLWDKTKKFMGKVNNLAKKTNLVSRALGMIPHPYSKIAATEAAALGYGYSGGSTRMRGVRMIPPGSFYRTY